MSATPPRTSKRRAFHERTPSEQNRLQVRLVPYSPPRLSFDGSLPALSRSASAVDCSASLSRPSSRGSPSNVKGKGKGRACPTHRREHAPSYSVLSRPPTSSDRNVGSADSLSVSSPDPESPEPTPFGLYSAKRVSLLPHSFSTSSATYSSRSAPRSSTVPSSFRGPSGSDALVDDCCGSPLTPLHEEFPSEAPTPTSDRSNSASPSSWNRRFVGGLRKGYRRASGISQTASIRVVRLPVSNPRLLSRLRRAPAASQPIVCPPRARDSSQSAGSESIQSERSNYEVYANSSPAPGNAAVGSVDGSLSTDFEDSSLHSSHANVVVLGSTSSGDDGRPSESEANDHVASGGSTPRLQLGLDFSRESLLVSPLQPSHRGSEEQPGALKSSYSRGSSYARPMSSASSIVVEEAFSSLLAGAAPADTTGEASGGKSARRPANSASVARWVLFRRPQWNTALSTVPADSERVRDGQSHTLPSVSASGASGSQGNAAGDYPARPSPAYGRPSTREQHRSTIRLIRNQDEHGDGLADLEALHHHPSRSRMHSLISSYPSDRNLRSSSSTRSSLSRSSVPAWAR